MLLLGIGQQGSKVGLSVFARVLSIGSLLFGVDPPAHLPHNEHVRNASVQLLGIGLAESNLFHQLLEVDGHVLPIEVDGLDLLQVHLLVPDGLHATDPLPSLLQVLVEHDHLGGNEGEAFLFFGHRLYFRQLQLFVSWLRQGALT